MGDSKWKDAGRGRQVFLRRPVSQGPCDCLKPGGLVTVFAGSKQCPLQFLHPCLQCVIFFYNLYFCRYYEEKPQEEFQEEPKKVQEESQSGSRGATASSRVFEILVHLIPFFLFFVCGLIQVPLPTMCYILLQFVFLSDLNISGFLPRV